MLGSKRLVSMPDRMTNTVVDTAGATMTRPSPISASEADIGTVERWCVAARPPSCVRIISRVCRRC